MNRFLLLTCREMYPNKSRTSGIAVASTSLDFFSHMLGKHDLSFDVMKNTTDTCKTLLALRCAPSTLNFAEPIERRGLGFRFHLLCRTTFPRNFEECTTTSHSFLTITHCLGPQCWQKCICIWHQVSFKVFDMFYTVHSGTHLRHFIGWRRCTLIL